MSEQAERQENKTPTRLRFGNRSRFIAVFSLLLCLLTIGLILNVNIGSVSIKVWDVFKMIWDGIRFSIAKTFLGGE